MGGLRQEVGQPVTATTETGTGTAVASGCKVKAIYVQSAGTAGSVVLRDGGVGGTTLLDIATPAAAGPVYIDLPDGGIDFAVDVHITLTTVTSATIFYR